MNVLVTGANGFMGSHLVKKLLDGGQEVKAMVLKGTNEDFIKDLNCKIVYADVTKPETLKECVNNVEVVFHLAAMPSDAWSSKIFRVNYQGTKNVFDASLDAGVRRLVYMSSLVVHGFRDYVKADENTPLAKPKWYKRPYIKSKILCERFLQENKDKMEITIIRPGFMPFGPHDMLTAKRMLRLIATGKTVPNINKGLAKVCYIYVENLADGVILAGTRPEAAGNTYLILDDDPPFITMAFYMKTMYEKFGQKPSKASIPYKLALPLVALVDTFYRIFIRKKPAPINVYLLKVAKYNLFFKSDKAKKELGFEPNIPLDEGIKRTVAWYKDYFKR